jgi:LPS sulfotransferase NodH
MVHLAQLLNLPPRIYEQSICKHLKRDSGPTGLASLERCSLVACTARSGSSLLRDCLKHYGTDHREWLNTNGTIKRAVDAGEASSLTEYGDYMARSATNGRFDMKGTFPALLFLYETHELPEHKDAWRFIHLRRSNVVRQAISSLIAAKTGQWTDRMPARREISDADYSFDKIAKSVLSIIQQHANIEKAFAVLEIEPARITYEDFIQDISGNTWTLARHIGLDVPAEPIEIKSTIKRQSTELNARWEARFREELDTTLRER